MSKLTQKNIDNAQKLLDKSIQDLKKVCELLKDDSEICNIAIEAKRLCYKATDKLDEA